MVGELRLPSPRSGTSDRPPPKHPSEYLVDDLGRRARVYLALMLGTPHQQEDSDDMA